jgi:ABC-type multidrug transport system fused ATPase/permease subunit
MFHTALYLADMDGFLHYAAERAPQRGELAVAGPLEEIRLDEAVYRYPGKDNPAVAGVSLTVRRGEILAGKGRVLWNGLDVADLDPDSLWQSPGLVPQNFAQRPLSVRDNVTLDQPRGQGDDLAWQALEAVGLREAIEDLPDGVSVAAGERQAVPRASASYKRDIRCR